MLGIQHVTCSFIWISMNRWVIIKIPYSCCPYHKQHCNNDFHCQGKVSNTPGVQTRLASYERYHDFGMWSLFLWKKKILFPKTCIKHYMSEPIRIFSDSIVYCNVRKCQRTTFIYAIGNIPHQSEQENYQTGRFNHNHSRDRSFWLLNRLSWPFASRLLCVRSSYAVYLLCFCLSRCGCATALLSLFKLCHYPRYCGNRFAVHSLCFCCSHTYCIANTLRQRYERILVWLQRNYYLL